MGPSRGPTERYGLLAKVGLPCAGRAQQSSIALPNEMGGCGVEDGYQRTLERKRSKERIQGRCRR